MVLLSSFSFMLDMLNKLKRKDRRHLAPMSPIEILSRIREKLDKLRRFMSGMKRDETPTSPN